MAEVRGFDRKQLGFIDNSLMENRNPSATPQFVGVARWKSFKDWEALWLKPDFQKLVTAVGEVGDITPGTYSPVKR